MWPMVEMWTHLATKRAGAVTLHISSRSMLAMVPSHFAEIQRIIDKILDIGNRQICLFISQYHNIRQIRLRING